MKIRLEFEIPLTKEEILKIAKTQGISLYDLSRKAGFGETLLWNLLKRRGGAQYETMRRLLLPLGIDLKPIAREAIAKIFEEEKP